jgi:hypothetical protein
MDYVSGMETEAHQSLQIVSVAGPGSASSLTEDIGTLSETPPMPFSSFQAPKPGLKANKRSQARGKGVMGAVLAANGTLKHEPLRIL